MSTELVLTSKFRKRIPEEHRTSLDARIQWLWMQRFGTVQSVYLHSPDLLDVTAANLYIQAIVGRDLDTISQILQRLEGGAVHDTELGQETTIRV